MEQIKKVMKQNIQNNIDNIYIYTKIKNPLNAKTPITNNHNINTPKIPNNPDHKHLISSNIKLKITQIEAGVTIRIIYYNL